MKMRINMKWIMGCLLCMVALNGMTAEISDVVAKQRWPWSRLVDIDYMLTGEPDELIDIVLTAKDGSTTLIMPPYSLTGDIYGVAPGQNRIVWDPTVTQYTNNLTLTQFNVTLVPITSPLYMIVDLSTTPTTTEYVTEADLTNDVWGTWVRNPVTNRGDVVQSVIWTGVTNDIAYKTDKLVLRRIPSGEYYEGDEGAGNKAANVTLTKDQYVGVFEVTQQQWNRVMNSGTGTNIQAKHTVSYNDIRGANVGTNWPASSDVDATSFMGKLRAKTGISEFDLPTAGQWEYACRAETTTYFNDGLATSAASQLDVLGWYSGNQPSAAAQPVGGLLPNAWGLYDMHGNVWEWCLDWHATSPETGIDPDGPDSGSNNVRRGGSWHYNTVMCRSAYLSNSAPPSWTHSIGNGFRLVRTLP